MKPLFAFLSGLLFMFFLLAALNYYLYFSGRAKEPEYISWTIDQTTYSPRYIYWSKEPLLTSPLLTFQPKTVATDNTHCKRILFLGDSFTFAPSVDPRESYPSRVSRGYADYIGVCVEQLRLAVGGASNDQEFARFMDDVNFLQPDIVFWQFYWNDLYENIIQALYSVKNGRLERKAAWLNTMFIAGYLNQNIPFLRYTTLGRHLLYLGEVADFFGYRDMASIGDSPAFYAYNDNKIRLMIRAVEELSKTKKFELYSTIAPLECQMTAGQNCPPWLEDAQNNLRKILLDYPHYVSMEYPNKNDEVLGVANDLNEAPLFGLDEEKILMGYRHLTQEGNRYYGGVLLGNFLFNKFSHVQKDKIE